MKNNGGNKDVNRTSAIAGLVVLAFLVVILVGLTIKVSIHTNKYLKYEEAKIVEKEVKLDSSEICELDVLKKAKSQADELTVNVDVKNLEFNNRDENGNCIQKEFGAPDCEDKITKNAALVQINNIKKDFELEISNDYDESIISIISDGEALNVERRGNTNDREYQKGKDNYSFASGNQQRIVNYTLYVYYNKGDCQRILVRKVTFETPQYNFLSRLTACEGKEELVNCQKFIYSGSPLSKDEFNLSDVLLDIEKTKASRVDLEHMKTALIIACVIVIIVLIISIIITVIGVRKVRKGGALHENEIDEDYDEDKSSAYEEYKKNNADEASDEE